MADSRTRYNDLRRQYRLARKTGDLASQLEAISSLRSLTNKWDTGAEGPIPAFRRNYKIGGQFRTVDFFHLSPDARVHGQFAERYRTRKLHAELEKGGKLTSTELRALGESHRYVLHTTNSCRWALQRWDFLDKSDQLLSMKR